MDSQVSSSFIPKKPVTESPARRGGTGSLLFLLALLIFITSLVAGGGTFLYKQYLTSSLAAKDESLKRAEGAYDAGVIQDLIRLDGRIQEAKSLMDKHVAPSAFFTYLSGATLASVQFTEFAYDLQGDGTATISLAGKGNSFSAVALQSDEFGASRVLREVVFSDIKVGGTGEVTFSVTAKVDSSLLQYRKNLTGGTSSAGQTPSGDSVGTSPLDGAPASTETTPEPPSQSSSTPQQ